MTIRQALDAIGVGDSNGCSYSTNMTGNSGDCAAFVPANVLESESRRQ